MPNVSESRAARWQVVYARLSSTSNHAVYALATTAHILINRAIRPQGQGTIVPAVSPPPSPYTSRRWCMHGLLTGAAIAIPSPAQLIPSWKADRPTLNQSRFPIPDSQVQLSQWRPPTSKPIIHLRRTQTPHSQPSSASST
ncbi:uncharacterized protein BO97DRAFT_427159 [Aspergillus homomorphus CBS 101889]|uniref:Uncharacterized protein n=1 Tax=Aspergillus homomorphus (strain CBS 101889) TaxID=1450537 RepID=A0A395HPI9_ASPHC|nr:hypothetical protein BO97DRAFT_427159 [Aspergillus homomorphus CBS 101889]RAL09737.1 hypothetical protein BO97DRAFT_427159 [Aspergillus homomorphus CBS 101889]